MRAPSASSRRDGRSRRSTARRPLSTACSRSRPTSPTRRAAVERAVTELGPLKAVVNAAGIYPPSTLESATVELYRRTFDVNVLGTLLVTQAAAPHLVEGGAVVNFASIDAFVPSPGQLLYCASKAAVVALTRSLALELAPRVRVNALAPGWVDTPGNRRPGGWRPRSRPCRSARGDAGGDADLVWFLAGEGPCHLRHRRDADGDGRQRVPLRKPGARELQTRQSVPACGSGSSSGDSSWRRR